MKKMQTRQQEIFNLLVEEYIKTAEPVGSLILVRNYKLGFSPATVRNEMAELEEKGYLSQPHTSAGRVPTDKGYRFFIDNLMNALKMAIEKNKEQRQFAKDIAKTISYFSNNLGICGFLEMDDFSSAGFGQLLKEPEFTKFNDTFGILEDALAFFDEFDREMEKLFKMTDEETKVFIGKENEIKELDDFSFVVSRCQRKGVIGILGPKRMDYARNIALVNCVKELIDRSF
jgi:transcriptional regulator of heat shock response